jgi:Uma2 family endonuclease
MSEPAYPLAFPEENGSSWPVQGRWTYADYLRLPDDGQRYEVIRGHLFVTATPTFEHQFTVLRLGSLLDRFVFAGGLGVVLAAPFDIRLPDRIADPVEPDIVVFKNGNLPRQGEAYFQGVPDLVVEVLSPSTRRRDRTIKLDAFRDAGVPEYWLVDPKTRTVVVYSLSEDRRSYVELNRSGAGGEAASGVLSGLRITVAEIFWS